MLMEILYKIKKVTWNTVGITMNLEQKITYILILFLQCIKCEVLGINSSINVLNCENIACKNLTGGQLALATDNAITKDQKFSIQRVAFSAFDNGLKNIFPNQNVIWNKTKSGVKLNETGNSNDYLQIIGEKYSESEDKHVTAKRITPNESEAELISFLPTENYLGTTELLGASGQTISSTDVYPSHSHSGSVNNTSGKQIFSFKTEAERTNSDICICDLKIDECDLNCCCDPDCTESMSHIFTTCNDKPEFFKSNICFESEHILSYNETYKRNNDKNGLLCLIKNNIPMKIPDQGEEIIENVTQFQNRIMGKKTYTFASLTFDSPKFKNLSYHIGDYLWTLIGRELVPFGIPKQTVNMQCSSVKNVNYLTEHSVHCAYSMPKNRKACENAHHFEMFHYLKDIKIIKSPPLITSNLSDSNNICNQEACLNIKPYICPQSSTTFGCVEAPPVHVLWDADSCRNIVSSVEYHIYHNGTEGVKEFKAYFTLKNVSYSADVRIIQSIKVKYYWAKNNGHVFMRSGNPGYIIGKPIIAGRKVTSSNETSSTKKVAIELPINAEYWLSVFSSRAGICNPDQRKPIKFGEDGLYSCYVRLPNDFISKDECSRLQENIFNLLLGNDYILIKMNNEYSKYVATFGNSKIEDTGDWVKILFDIFPIISSQPLFSNHQNNIICKNIFTDLFIVIGYSKIGSFEKPQNKILGVQYRFGSPKRLIFHNNLNCDKDDCSVTVKISTVVKFTELTNTPKAEYAETPGFEAKLPHDFFYPFFSNSPRLVYPRIYTLFAVNIFTIMFYL